MILFKMPWTFFTSLAGPSLIALLGFAALYVLHHLRSQPKRQIVETLLFWDPADIHPVARSLWSKRLRQPLAMLLLSIIVLLLAIALAASRWKSSHHPVNAVVFDAGSESASPAGLNLSTDFESAIEDALAAEPSLLIASAEQPRLISDADEPAAVAGLRLKDLQVSQTAAASTLSLLLAANLQGADGGNIDWFTSQLAVPANLPSFVASRVQRHWIKPSLDHLSIADVKFEPSESDLTQGTLIVTVGCGATGSNACVQINSDGLPPQSVNLEITPRQTTQARFEKLPADGSRLLVTLRPTVANSELVHAEFTLPRLLSPRFFGIENAPIALRNALLCLGPSVENAQGAIAIVNFDKPIPPGAAGALVIVPDSGVTRSLLFEPGQSTLTREIGFQDTAAVIGSGKLPVGAVILSAGGRAVMVSNLSARQPVVYALDSVMSEDASLPRLTAFPLLMQRICNALIQTAPSSLVETSQRHVDDPLWPGASDRTVAVVNPFQPAVENRATQRNGSEQIRAHHVDWVYWLLWIVVGLLMTEIILFKRRVIA